jgi:anti-sigma B factor antagonist
MSTPPAKMLVFVGDEFACVKIIGRANFTSSIDFKTLVNELRQKACKFFVLDLSECTLMDSTFLGTLAGFGLKMNQGQAEPSDSPIELLNPNTRVTEQLENLGILHLFRMAHGASCAPDGVETMVPSKPSREETTRACLEAHRTLMQVNPENMSRFKDLTQFLAEDLKKYGSS